MCLFSGCGRKAAPAAPPLRVGIDLWAGYYPLVLADARGFLAEENITVEIVVPRDTKRMIAEFAAGHYDAIAVSLGDVLLITRAQPDVRIILCSDESTGGDVILGRSPLTGPEDIRGKRIGTSAGGFGELFVRRFLQKHQLAPGAVTIVGADAADVPGLLERGVIDVGHTWEPYASESRASGTYAWFDSRETPGLILDGLLARGRLLREDSERVRGLLRAWFRAADWWAAHREEGNALIEKRLVLPEGSVSLEGVRLLDLEANRRAFSPGLPGESLDLALTEYVEFFVTRGMLGARLGPGEMIDGSFLP